MSVLRQVAVLDVDDFAPERIKILIADDHPLIIAGIRRTIEQVNDIEVVGEARSGSELIQLVECRCPDLVLMDLKMPGVPGGVETIQRIRRHWPAIKTVVLSACDDRFTIDAALQAGASAYVLKSAHAVDIASVLRQTSVGAVFDAPTLKPARSIDGAPGARALTERERSILSAVASGMTTRAISQELWISEHTIKFHLTNIYRKLGVANRAAAIRCALDNGIA